MTEIKNLGPSIYDVHTGEGVKKSLFPYGRHCGWGFKKLFLDVINGWPLGIAITLEEINFSRV